MAYVEPETTRRETNSIPIKQEAALKEKYDKKKRSHLPSNNWPLPHNPVAILIKSDVEQVEHKVAPAESEYAPAKRKAALCNPKKLEDYSRRY